MHAIFALMFAALPLACAQEVVSNANKSDTPHLTLTLQSLPKRQQLQLAQLSVFPYTFSEEAAAAVLGCDTDRAATLLTTLYGHSLLLYDTTKCQHFVHMAVKQQAPAAAPTEQLLAAKVAFVTYIMQQLADWAAMYQSPAFALAMSLAKQHAADIEELWRLLEMDQPTREQCCMQAAKHLAVNTVGLLLGAVRLCGNSSCWEAIRGTLPEGATEELASVLHVLALCLYDQGQYADAEPVYRKALELRQKVLGPEHPDTLSGLNNLAVCLEKKGKRADAEPLYRQALELRQKVLGPEHPDTISSINNLASCLDDQGQPTAAEPMYRQALELQQKVLGPEHPNTVSSINNLASCLHDQGKYAAAEPMLRQALELRQKVLGPEHPGTIRSMNNLAVCLNSQDKYAAAEPKYRQALELRQKVLGPEHPDTISSINDLADCLNSQGKYAAAEPMYRQALELRQKMLGPEHPDTISSINDLGDCLKALGKSI